MPPDNPALPEKPASIRNAPLPTRAAYRRSPDDWRDQVLYFLLLDRFSDGQEESRPLLDRQHRGAARTALPDGTPWRWANWAESGAHWWQGGTLKGLSSKLPYLKRLGVTVIWISPVFKQRARLDTYHGYGVQDFLDIDPHFGTTRDLIDLVDEAHRQDVLVILDIIFNHSGANWVYPGGQRTLPYKPYPGRHPFGRWLGAGEQEINGVQGPSDGVWPLELQDPECYTRAGKGNLGEGDIGDDNAEHKRTDFFDLRDFHLEADGLLNDLARCYKYWIALTDCDGFRIDTLKHVTFEQARNFCGSIKEFAAGIGKSDFFLVAEVAGGDYNQERYLAAVDRNLNAVLDIGDMRRVLHGVAKGYEHPARYFLDGFDPRNTMAGMGSHRNLGKHHVSVLDDHDHVWGDKIRFSSEAASEHQVAAAVALQLFSLGIPCIYYGTEQSLAGPEASERGFLPNWNRADGSGYATRYLREAMFGPTHPRQPKPGDPAAPEAALNKSLPGFGPFGTAGAHCFDEHSPAFLRIAALTAVRRKYPVLRSGRQYLRQLSFLGKPFAFYGPGEIVAWSRVLGETEALCLFNSHGSAGRGADVLVDASLNPTGSSLTVALNTAQAASPQPSSYNGFHPVGSSLPVRRRPDGTAYVEVRSVTASEVLVLLNRP